MFFDPEEKKKSEIKFVVTRQNSKFVNTLWKEATATNSKETAITNSPNNLSF